MQSASDITNTYLLPSCLGKPAQPLNLEDSLAGVDRSVFVGHLQQRDPPHEYLYLYLLAGIICTWVLGDIISKMHHQYLVEPVMY